MMRLIGIISLMIIFLLAPSLLDGGTENKVQDNWVMFLKNPQNNGVTENKIDPPLRLRWSCRTRLRLVPPFVAGNFSPFARPPMVDCYLKDGVLYTLPYDTLFAIDAKKGNMLGKKRFRKKWIKQWGIGKHFGGELLVTDEAIYILIRYKFLGVLGLAALDQKTKKVLWTYKIQERFFRVMNHLNTDSENIYLYYSMFDLPSDISSTYVYAVNAKTGKERWKNSYKDKGTIEHNTVVIDKGILYFVLSSRHDKLYAVDAKTGALKWIYPLESEYGDIFSIEKNTAPIIQNGVIYLVLDFDVKGRSLLAIDLEKRAKKWEFKRGRSFLRSFAVEKDRVFIGSHEYIYSLEKDSGDLIWASTITRYGPENLISTKNTIYTILSDTVKAFRKSDGKELWSYSIKENHKNRFVFTEDYYISSLVAANNMLYVCCNNGGLYCFEETK